MRRCFLLLVGRLNQSSCLGRRERDLAVAHAVREVFSEPLRCLLPILHLGNREGLKHEVLLDLQRYELVRVAFDLALNIRLDYRFVFFDCLGSAEVADVVWGGRDLAMLLSEWPDFRCFSGWSVIIGNIVDKSTAGHVHIRASSPLSAL